MKFTVAILALLISASAFPHGRHMGPNHYKGAHGAPYGGRGHGGGYAPAVVCGNHQSSGGNVGVHNGYGGHKNIAGNVYFNQSRGNCTPNGYSSQNLGGSVGIVNGRVGGGVYFNQSSSN